MTGASVRRRERRDGAAEAGRATDLSRVARVAKALSDQTRLKMLGVLARGRGGCELPDVCARNVPGPGTPAGICVCELQERFGLAQSRTSYHLRVLREAGLVTEEERGKWTFYDIDRAALSAALQTLQRLVDPQGTRKGVDDDR